MYFSGFIDDNPTGTLSKVKMMEMYASVLTVQKASIFVDQIFNKFDTDNNGSIDFKVTVVSVSLQHFIQDFCFYVKSY